MALNASNYPPKTTTELLTGSSEPLPVPYEAVAGEPAVDIFVGEITEFLGGQEPQKITVHIGGENLVDIIADLTDRLEALETP